MKRSSALKRKTRLRAHKPLRRVAILRATRGRRGSAEKVESAIWRRDLGPCVVCPAEGGVCSGPVQGHHVVAQQTLRKRGLVGSLMDVRNRLPVCERRHAQHTTGFRPIPRELLPASVFEFAGEHGLGWYIDRHYPERVAA